MELFHSFWSSLVRAISSVKPGDKGKDAGAVRREPQIGLSSLHEASLKESDERFQATANVAPVKIWLADQSGQRTFFNHNWLKFRGRALEQEQGFGWLEGVDPGDLVQLMNSYLNSFRKHEPYQLEYRILGADGSYHWLLESGAARLDAQGNFLGFIGSCSDVTESRRTSELLSKSETRLQILDHIAEGLNTGRPAHLIISETVERLFQQFKDLRISYAEVTEDKLLKVLCPCGPGDPADISGGFVKLDNVPEYAAALAGPTPIVVMDLRRPGVNTAYRNLIFVSGVRAVLEMPVWHEGCVKGVLSFHCRDPRFWSGHEIATVKGAASWIGLTLRHVMEGASASS